MKIVDLSGYMFSGKSAVSDILREFDGVHVPNYLVEFDLLRMPGGLIDLKNAVMDWSPIRTYAALMKFSNLVDKIAIYPRFPVNLIRSGYGYSQRYPSLILSKNKFINSLVTCKWETPWPYADIDDGPFDTFVRKILRKISVHKKRNYLLVDRDRFEELAQEFVRSILLDGIQDKGLSALVTHNALEPFSPQKNINLLGKNALCIVVDRDPRDIYATAITSSAGFNEDVGLNRLIAGAHNVDIFIQRYLTYRRNTDFNDDRVLRINFKDLVLNYDYKIEEIRDFIGLQKSQHIHRKLHFNPELSIKNTEVWAQDSMSRYADDFNKIASECIL